MNEDIKQLKKQYHVTYNDISDYIGLSADYIKHIMSKELKPCPFCGCNKTYSWHIGHYDKPWIVECCRCQAQGPHSDTEDEAFKLWNRRVRE